MMDKDIEALLKNFRYSDGHLYRVMWRGKPCEPYKILGAKNSSGYRSVRISAVKKIGLHVAIWVYHNKRWPENEIDHWDQDKDNNEIDNLRDATKTQNMQNQGPTSLNTSGYKNVSFNKATGKWRVDFRVNKIHKNFGFYENIEDAIFVAEQKRSEIYV